MTLSTRVALTALILTAPLLSSCSQKSEPTIAAGFYPLAWVADDIATDHYDVVNLTTPGGEPHDLELTTQETAVIARSKLLIHLQGFQPAVDSAADNVAEGDVLDVAKVVTLAAAPGHAEDHADETAADADAHDHGDLDPHFWLDPLLMADYSDGLAKTLAGLDPDHADDYAARAAKLRTQLETLDQEFAQGLSTCTRDTIVVSHDAFGYWTRYGLTIQAINGLSPDAEPTPAALAQLQKLIKQEGITTVFSERLASAKMASTLANDAGVTTAVLDPIEGLSDDTSDEDYLTLMAQNLQTLREANGCN